MIHCQQHVMIYKENQISPYWFCFLLRETESFLTKSTKNLTKMNHTNCVFLVHWRLKLHYQLILKNCLQKFELILNFFSIFSTWTRFWDRVSKYFLKAVFLLLALGPKIYHQIQFLIPVFTVKRHTHFWLLFLRVEIRYEF